MTERDTGAMRQRLEQLRAELRTGRENLPAGEDSEIADVGAGQHNADAATDTFIRERNLALQGNADDILAQIDAALRRYDAGTYGVCERCGRLIGAERLEALPYTAFCIECARERAGSQ
ncbi:MAG: conjugal transfer protein TraR [Chloroflexales bacterium]|nr:conjugal transfer protein TraR [Chloroflexales bacterium]